MSTNTDNIRLQLRELFEADADDIFAARKRGKVVRGTNNIAQSGEDVEYAVRQVLTSRLPSAYNVGHGHVVDRTLKTCGQFDVIVSDKFANPLLFSTKGNSDYLPIESVYAVGEIKSLYDKQKKPFEKFSKHLEELHELNRPDVDQNFYLVGGKGRGIILPGETSDRRPRKNPLFSFMFFVESGQFKLSDIKALYESTPIRYLPNVVCFLDLGIIAYGQYTSKNYAKTNHFHATPEFCETYDNRGQQFSRRTFHKITGDKKNGAHLGWLYHMLAHHLYYSTLQPVEPMLYANSILADPNIEQSVL
ncbi:MAG TPA: DUF6602 domain-containing protein [Oculatellaceae cyanobacterium]